MQPLPSELRHSIRGTMNALKLCTSALEMPLSDSDKVEFLIDIEKAAGKLVALMLDVDQLPEAGAPSDNLLSHPA